ncbi:MAG: redox-regulated ATPase YchF [Patescibacteria group bacterium]
MSKLSIGIVGLPNVGKSTLFQKLTGIDVTIANYPFATIDPNVGIVPVPDERLEKLAVLSKSEKKIPAIIEFYDIAGLVKGASTGAGLGNQFLSHIREVSAIVEVVRCFPDPSVIHVEGTVGPVRDIETIELELLIKDESAKDGSAKLTDKPIMYVLNGKEEDISPDLIQFLEEKKRPYVRLDLSGDVSFGDLVRLAYKTLNLVSFFTTGPKETRAWTIRRGSTAPQAAGEIHTDFEQKFIRAEVVDCKTLLAAGGWQETKRLGKMRLEGKEYLVQDGDVLIIRHG